MTRLPTYSIIVTDGDQRAALAAVRSLGQAGHRIHVTSSRSDCLSSASRHAAEAHVLPNAEHMPEAWSQELSSLCDRVGADWVLPITELSLGTLHATNFPSMQKVLGPTPKSYALAVDKYNILEVGKRVGIHVPRTRLIEDPRELTELPVGFEFPVILKARRSRFRIGERWGNGGVVKLSSQRDLLDARTQPGFAGGALLQEYVEGHGEAIFLLVWGGETLATFAHRRIREKPPSGGVSVLRDSIEPDPELLEASRALLAEIGFGGVAMVEFRRSPDGSAALMEINPRLWGSLQLAIDSGVDFPNLMLRMQAGYPISPPTMRIGVRSRWLLGDLDHLFICLRKREMRESTGRTRFAVVTDFLKSFVGDGSRLEIFRRDDWRPFLREMKLWLFGS